MNSQNILIADPDHNWAEKTAKTLSENNSVKIALHGKDAQSILYK